MMMSCSKKNVDRLSHLPEEILSQILSLMPTKSAVTTSVLSKRWRYAWTFITNLDFDFDVSQRERSFPEFVDWVLDSCKTSQINLFRLDLSYNAAQESSVSNWIDKAVRLNVRELHIASYAMSMYELPFSLITCKTLTRLRIHIRFQKFSCAVNLPSLKILDIVGYLYHLDQAFQFVSGSPMLESLSLNVSCEINDKDCTFNIPTLKRLQLPILRFWQYNTRVVLNVPNLEYLMIGDCQFMSFVMEDVSSLVEASISPYLSCLEAANNVWAELLNGVSGVKSVSLRYIPPGLFLPIFPNLTRLELKSCEKIKIFQILESCPKLKHLYIEEHVDSALCNPKSVPTCLLTNLTAVKFSKCKGSECDLQFLGYILGNATSLKTVTITWDKSRIKEEAWLCARLLKRKRASRCCEIQFHGSLSHSSIS